MILQNYLTESNISIVVAITAILWGIVPAILKYKFEKFRKKLVNVFPDKNNFHFPKIAVIMPCKGLDVSFENNLQKVLSQSYPNWELHFSVAERTDPAYCYLEKIALNNPQKVFLHIAGIKPGCGQKMTNMVKAIDSVSSDVEVLVFIDSDTSIHVDYLKVLVLGLYLPNVGASTGYHVFLPQGRKVGSYVRTIWALAGCLILADESKNFSIGAATAIRKDVFEKLNIKEKLANTLSDTFVFTNTIKEAGLSVQFNPECLFISPDDSDLKQVSDWSDRLTLLSKTYSIEFWKLVSLSYAFAGLFYLSWILFFFLSSPFWILTSVALAISQIIMGSLLISYTSDLLSEHYPKESMQLRKLKWRMSVYAPLTGLLMILSTVKSIFINTTTWRGITYKLYSKDRVEVISKF